MVRKKAVPDIPLPPAGDMTPAQHAQISRRFLEHFHIEKRKGNRLQASEKIWGAVSHAISAVAAERGLKHGNYFEKQNVARQIGVELAEAATSSQVPVEKRDSLVDNFLLPYERAENLHRNFHENKRTWPDIDGGQVLAAKFVEELDNYREKGYSEFTPRNEYDSQRWAMLNGHSSKKRDALARYPLERTINLDWRRPDGDDDGSGGGVPAGNSPPNNPPTPLTLNRREQRTTTPVEPGDGERPRRQRRQEPKPPAQGKAAVGRGKERRRVIKPRAAAQRQSARR